MTSPNIVIPGELNGRLLGLAFREAMNRAIRFIQANRIAYRERYTVSDPVSLDEADRTVHRFSEG